MNNDKVACSLSLNYWEKKDKAEHEPTPTDLQRHFLLQDVFSS